MSAQRKSTWSIPNIIFATSLVLTAGCDKESATRSEKDAEVTETKAEAELELEPVVDAYESVRAALAGDDLGMATSGASALRSAARTASLDALASASESLAKAPSGDADAVRKAFGGVSHALISALSKHSELRQTLHVFECPMAPAYGKWVQRDANLENPYMGKSMLKCGSASEWDA
ncbi:MAG: hypothetical protein ACRBN8_45275 [Nannocystales bacterium]